jgi:hypothetical protein
LTPRRAGVQPSPAMARRHCKNPPSQNSPRTLRLTGHVYGMEHVCFLRDSAESRDSFGAPMARNLTKYLTKLSILPLGRGQHSNAHGFRPLSSRRTEPLTSKVSKFGQTLTTGFTRPWSLPKPRSAWARPTRPTRSTPRDSPSCCTTARCPRVEYHPASCASHLAQTRDLLVKQRSALKAKINNKLARPALVQRAHRQTL